jgi:hypothetical protein
MDAGLAALTGRFKERYPKEPVAAVEALMGDLKALGMSYPALRQITLSLMAHFAKSLWEAEVTQRIREWEEEKSPPKGAGQRRELGN